MANITITPAVPAGGATGAASSVAALGKEKTIIVGGSFTGTVQLEANCGGGFVPVASFSAPGQQTVMLAANEMRIVRPEGSGTPSVSISANDDGAQFVNLPIAGTSVDVSALGTFNTVIADGTVEGVLNVEMSQDEVEWVPVMSFADAGHQSAEFVAPFLRVRHANAQGSTPEVYVGAVNDAGPTSRYIVDTALRTVPGDALVLNSFARFDTTASNIIRSLPAASSFPNGGCFTIKNEVGGNSVSAQRNGGDTIDSVAANLNIAAGVATKFVSDGVSNWTTL